MCSKVRSTAQLRTFCKDTCVHMTGCTALVCCPGKYSSVASLCCFSQRQCHQADLVVGMQGLDAALAGRPSHLHLECRLTAALASLALILMYPHLQDVVYPIDVVVDHWMRICSIRGDLFLVADAAQEVASSLHLL